MEAAASGGNPVIYYVEDEKNIRELAVYALSQAGIEAKGLPDDAAFRRACAERVPDAVLLDIMLPDTDGLTILARIRQTPGLRDVPVMMVSRVRALLRRSKAAPARREPVSDVLEVGPIRLSPSRHEASVDGASLNLTVREFDLLSFLMRSPGVVFNRETLLQRVWGWDFDGGSRTVDVHVQTLRQKLGQAADLIGTVRGVGYRLRG